MEALNERECGDAGYYILQFENGECYVGQSQYIPRRVASDHPKKFKDIEVAFVRTDTEAMASPLPNRHLLAVEKQLIHSVQQAKMPARNLSDMTITPGTESFRNLVPAEDQERWLNSPVETNNTDKSESQFRTADDFPGAKHNYENFRRTYPKHANQVERVIGAYIARCIPFPSRTEYGFWSVSALPGTQNKDFQRLACLTTSWTETLVITEAKATGAIEGFVQVADVELFGEDETLASYLSVIRRHPGCYDTEAGYAQSGPANSVLHATDLDALERLLDDTAVTRAAATAALNIMNKGATGKTRESHNPYLVDAALRSHSGT